MKVDEVLLRKLAELAGLELDECEVPALRDSLEELLQAYQAISQVETRGIEPLVHPFPEVPNMSEVSGLVSARPSSRSVQRRTYPVSRVLEDPEA